MNTLPSLDQTHSDTWERRIEQLGKIAYSEYLRSPEWLRIKAKAATRPFYQKCWICSSTNKLELHHRSYKWLGTKTPMRGLVALCPDCHEGVHLLAKDEDVSVRRATRRARRRVIQSSFSEMV